MRKAYQFWMLVVVAAFVAWLSHAAFIYAVSERYHDFGGALFADATYDDWLARVAIFLLLAIIAFLTVRSEVPSELKRSQAELQQLFDVSSDAMWVVSPDYEVLRVNSRLCSLLGLAEDDLIGAQCYDMFPCSYCHTDECPMSLALGGEELEEREVERNLPDGRVVTCLVSGVPLRDANGEVSSALESFRDITGRKAAQERLRWFQRMVDTTNDLVLMVDRNYVYRVVNAAYARAYERPAAEIIGRTMPEIIGEELFAEKIKGRLQRCLDGEEVRFQEWLEYPAHGPTYLDATYTPHEEADGSVSYVVITARDLTAEKRAEDAARRRDELLAAVAFASHSFLRETDWEQNLADFMSRLGEALQVSRAVIYKNETESDGEVVIKLRAGWTETGEVEELPGHEVRSHSYESVGLERWRQELSQGHTIAGIVEELPEAEREVFAPDGIEAVAAVPIFVGKHWWGFISVEHRQAGRGWTDAEKDSVHIAADILAAAIRRRHIEDDVRQERDRAQNYFDIAGVLLVALDSDGNISLINRKGCEILGYEEEELIGASWFDTALTPEVRDRVKAVFAQLMTGNVEPVERAENIIRRKDGQERVVLWHNRVIRDEEGRIVGTLSSGEDITERKHAEEALRQISEEQEIILNSVRAAIWYKDTANSFLRVNRAAAEAVGLPAAEMAGKSSYELFPEEAEQYHQDDLEVIESGEAKLGIVERMQFASGEKRWVRTDKIPYRDDEGNIIGVIVFTVDINALKETQDALAAETERLRVTLRSIGDGVIATDIDGRLVLLNKVAETLTGWSQSEAEGRLLDEVFKIINEHSRAVVDNPVARVLAEGEVVGLANDTVLVSRDGTERVIADSGAPIRDQQSRTIGAVLVFRDMTEARQREEEARRAETLESIGILAGGLAHDFNNLLSGIFGNIALARLDLASGEDATERLAAAEKAMSRAKHLTEQLLTFSSGGTPVRAVVSPRTLLQEAAEFALSGANTRCELNVADDLWHMEADAAQIARVVSNIVINSDQAMPDGGVIALAAENVSVGSGSVASLPGTRGLAPGRYVHIAIKDTGVGIPAKLLSRVFEPYFTTKQSGSGLGLSVSYSIIRQHGGHLHIESETGVGTTCHIYLPAVEAKAADGTEKPAEMIRGTGRVLVLEDEDVVWSACSGMLEVLGYEPCRAHDGAEMLQMYRAAMDTEQAFAAVIMDLTIPAGVGGKEAISELREMAPDVKAVVSSGYSSDPVMAEFETHGFDAMIAKPYRIEELAQVLHEVIGRG